MSGFIDGIHKILEKNINKYDKDRSVLIYELKDSDSLACHLKYFPILQFRLLSTNEVVDIYEYEDKIKGVVIMHMAAKTEQELTPFYTPYKIEYNPNLITITGINIMTELENFKNELNKHVVEFEYNKKDGSTRKAKGTTNLDLIPENAQPKNSERNYNSDTVRYYDVEKEGWRSFNKEKFVSFVKE